MILLVLLLLFILFGGAGLFFRVITLESGLIGFIVFLFIVWLMSRAGRI